MKRHWIEPLGIVVVLMLALGCSKVANENYAGAGKDAKSAVQKLGEGVKESGKIAEESLKKASAEAKVVSADAVMATKVKEALLGASGLDASKIGVSVKDGVIDLKGTVSNDDQKTQAEQIAKGLAGKDYKVHSGIQIKTGYQRSIDDN